MNIFFVWIAFCIPSAVVALSKDRNPLWWGIAGLVFGPIGFLTVGFMERKRDNRPLRKCPFCAEYIPEEAVLCKYCGSESKKMNGIVEDAIAGIHGYQKSEMTMGEDGILEVSPAKKATDAQKAIAICSILFFVALALTWGFINFYK